jgi:SLT domain-containing protein
MAAKTKHEFVLVGKDKASKVIAGVSKTTGDFLDTAHKLTSVLSNSINIVGSVSRAMKSLGGAMAVPIKAAQEQVRVETQLDAVLKSTGEAAGLNAEQLKDMAAEMQSMTTFGDEAVIGMQNLLLTFTNIGGSGGIFERTTKVALDVATAMGMDLKSSALQLGKALNDPATGLSMLTRVGITFSEEQKKVIKQLQATGDMAGAQTVILQELERQFGGSAEAAASTFGGAMTQVQNAVGDVMEALGNFVVKNEGVIAIVKELASGILDFATDLGKLGESQEGQIEIAQMFQKVLVGLVNTFATFIEVMGSMAKMFVDSAIAVADFLGVEALLTKEQRELLPEMQKVDAELANIEVSMISASGHTKEHRERYAELKVELKEVSKRKRELKAEYDSLGFKTEAITEKTDAAGRQMRDLADRLAAVNVAAAVTTAENKKLADSFGDVADGANEAAAATGQLAKDELAELNRSTFKYIDGLKRDLPDVSRTWLSLYLDLKKNIKDLPLEEQQVEVQKFHDALKNLFDRAVGGSVEAAASMNTVSGAVEEVGEKAEEAAPKVEKSFGLSIAGVIAAIRGILPEFVKETERAKAAWEQSAESMGNSLGNNLSDVFSDAMTGQATLYEGFESFNQNLKSSMSKALLDPIMGAQSPMAELFSMALSPISMVGEAIAENLFRPLVDGMKDYFAQKFTNAQADAAAMQSLDTATNATAQANAAATGGSMAASMAPAASLASIASFGAALAFGFLVTTVAMKVMDSFVGFAEGGFIDKDQVVRVGEGNKPEVIIPLTKPDRAKQLLAETFSRHPELFLSALSGRRGGSQSTSGATNNFTINVNGAADPSRTSAAVVARIDQMLGQRIKAKI